MPTPATTSGPKRKRGNPRWGQPMVLTPELPTQFELRVRQLQLTKQMYASSRALYLWCDKNKNRVYIPEWLLTKWGMTVDIPFGTAA